MTHCSRLNAAVIMSTTLRERGCAILQMITGRMRIHRTAKTIEGTRSSASGAPPMGEGNL